MSKCKTNIWKECWKITSRSKSTQLSRKSFDSSTSAGQFLTVLSCMALIKAR
ncbi:hypothetical protein TELCIR_10931 [Teladorsagia circumcincta]|uniref:Uncharacterized protein n=1 Tax=Teladorsagia circumcincta TaxID=45464 RepID=A0A2G9UAT7_TELCI|nr:hypothetical protein TELCIR_10931 [Teladorsagia circumcincta]